MKGTVRLFIDCGDAKKAEIINEALRIDNESYIESVAREKYIEAVASGSFSYLLNTINDFLCCLQIAIKINKVL